MKPRADIKSIDNDAVLALDYDALSGLHPRLLKLSVGKKVKLRPDLPAVEYKLPVDWGADPHSDPNWCFQLHCWRLADRHLYRFFRNCDSAHLGPFLALVLDWHRFHFTLGNESPHSWYDMAVGIRAARLSLLIAQVQTGAWEVPDRHRRVLYTLAEAHRDRLLSEEEFNPGNHGIFQAHGLMCLALVCGDVDSAKVATERMVGLVCDQFTEEGVHTENSPEYHFFVLNTLQRLQITRLFEGVLDPTLIERADALRAWFVKPEGHIAQFGDSSIKGPASGEVEPSAAIEGGLGRFLVKDLTRSGYLVVRSDTEAERSLYFAVTGCARTRVHKHADPGSFLLDVEGIPVVVDGGKYKYDKSDGRNYVMSAVAHSTIDRVKRSYGPKEVELDPSGSYFTTIGISRERATAKLEWRARDGSEFGRSCLFDAETGIEILDRVASGSGAYVSRLLLNGELAWERIAEDRIAVFAGADSRRIVIDGSGPIGDETVEQGFSTDYAEFRPALRLTQALADGEPVEWRMLL